MGWRGLASGWTCEKGSKGERARRPWKWKWKGRGLGGKGLEIDVCRLATVGGNYQAGMGGPLR